MPESIWALIVEDDPHNLVCASRLLSELGIQYKRNTTGANVPQQLRDMRPRPAFILLDTSLPLGDPLSICDHLQRDPLTRDIPVIAMYDAACQDWPQEMGCAALLPKPLPRNQLGSVIQQVLNDAQM